MTDREYGAMALSQAALWRVLDWHKRGAHMGELCDVLLDVEKAHNAAAAALRRADGLAGKVED